MNGEIQKWDRKGTVHRTFGVFYRLRRTIAQFTLLFKFVLKTSFGIIEELKAHKTSKLVPASLFLALQHCSCCSIVATFQLCSPTCLRKQTAVQELLEWVSYPNLEPSAEGLFLSCASVSPVTMSAKLDLHWGCVE